MKLQRQLMTMVLLIAFFVTFNLSIYHLFTKKCISDYSAGMQAKSIELEAYLPFDEDSKIVKVDTETKLEGDLPVVDGAAALYPVFSAFFHSLYPKEAQNFDGQDFTADSFLQMKNTRGAYKAVVDGEDDVVFCAKPSKEQLEYAAEKGVELDIVPIGCEAFVFLVNQENPVDNLTVEQIQGIYRGKYKNWSEVGGLDKTINPLQRNEGSGSQTAFLSFMGDEPAEKNWQAVFGSAIGFSFRYYVEGIVEDGGVKMLSVNGVYPDADRVSSGEYPITSYLYAVYRKDNPNKNIPILIEWILSEEGQRIVEESGYIRYSEKV